MGQVIDKSCYVGAGVRSAITIGTFIYITSKCTCFIDQWKVSNKAAVCTTINVATLYYKLKGMCIRDCSFLLFHNLNIWHIITLWIQSALFLQGEWGGRIQNFRFVWLCFALIDESEVKNASFFHFCFFFYWLGWGVGISPSPGPFYPPLILMIEN